MVWIVKMLPVLDNNGGLWHQTNVDYTGNMLQHWFGFIGFAP